MKWRAFAEDTFLSSLFLGPFPQLFSLSPPSCTHTHTKKDVGRLKTRKKKVLQSPVKMGDICAVQMPRKGLFPSLVAEQEERRRRV